ncbi:MAG TPA: TerB family tellurite resistance protein [Polyangiaceae bacterium]|jgi:uncharacterized tellurite resistance protein B-like protein
MIWLSNSTLGRLRDQLLESGRRPSVAAGSVVEALAQRIDGEFAPLCEAMYLMMSADGAISDEEREVLRGALRNLSGDSLRRADIEAMLDRATRNVEVEGAGARLRAVAAELAEDRGRAEVAFVLAAAIAFADNAIADNENETLNSLAEALGIDEGRAESLLDAVERDLAGESR